MTEQLGPTIINPYTQSSYGDFVLNPSWSAPYLELPSEFIRVEMVGAAARNMLLNGEGVCTAAAAGNSIEAVAQTFMGLSGKSEILIRQQLMIHAKVNQQFLSTYNNVHGGPHYLGNGRGGYIEPVYGEFLLGAPISYQAPLPPNTYDFYGTPLMPIAAIAYWIYGGGQDRNVHIEALNLQMVARDFQPLRALIDDPTKVGAFPIKTPFSYNVFDKAPIDVPAAGTIGRVSGNVEGTLIINPDNTYVFHGIYSLNRDLYDAGKSNRNFVQENLTTFLNQLGETFGHTDYYINILGTKTVELRGTR